MAIRLTAFGYEDDYGHDDSDGGLEPIGDLWTADDLPLRDDYLSDRVFEQILAKYTEHVADHGREWADGVLFSRHPEYAEYVSDEYDDRIAWEERDRTASRRTAAWPDGINVKDISPKSIPGHTPFASQVFFHGEGIGEYRYYSNGEAGGYSPTLEASSYFTGATKSFPVSDDETPSAYVRPAMEWMIEQAAGGKDPRLAALRRTSSRQEREQTVRASDLKVGDTIDMASLAAVLIGEDHPGSLRDMARYEYGFVEDVVLGAEGPETVGVEFGGDFGYFVFFDTDTMTRIGTASRRTSSHRRTAQALNDIMQFDHVIEVLEDGSIVDRNDIYAPELYQYEGGYDLYSGWELLDGHSGQYGYSGPLMHQSEFISGGLERRIREEPGVYVALVAYPDGSDPEFTEPESWAVARKVG